MAISAILVWLIYDPTPPPLPSPPWFVEKSHLIVLSTWPRKTGDQASGHHTSEHTFLTGNYICFLLIYNIIPKFRWWSSGTQQLLDILPLSLNQARLATLPWIWVVILLILLHSCACWYMLPSVWSQDRSKAHKMLVLSDCQKSKSTDIRHQQYRTEPLEILGLQHLILVGNVKESNGFKQPPKRTDCMLQGFDSIIVTHIYITHPTDYCLKSHSIPETAALDYFEK